VILIGAPRNGEAISGSEAIKFIASVDNVVCTFEIGGPAKCQDIAAAFEYYESQQHFGKVCLAL
jgi:hypothetical protein